MTTKKKYESLSLQELINKIAKSRYWDLPTMLGVVLQKLSGQSGDSRPYKVYTALLTQTGTNAPVATVLENTLGYEPIYTYGNVGNYGITLNNALFGKIVIVEQYKKMIIQNKIVESYVDNDDFIVLQSRDLTEVPADNILSDDKIEIRVYS